MLLHGSIGVEELLAWSPRNPYLAALAALLAYAVKSQTVVIPYALIATAVGLVFDLPAALAVNTLAPPSAYPCPISRAGARTECWWTG